jgi:glucan phosphoethanolaminetransferase (alkaline phosphatase superfamily)
MVYVDNMYENPIGQFGRMKMSHMAADTHDELIAMAKKIGVNTRWIQDEGEGGEHFDVSMSKREAAIQAGAKAVSMYELCPAMVERKGPNDKLIIVSSNKHQ